MPWMETAPMEQRERFIRDHRLDLYTMVELSARYGISRKTGYKWLARFEEAGRQGLQDRSRAPHQCPHRIADKVAALICAARRQHPSWGPAKAIGLAPTPASCPGPARQQYRQRSPGPPRADQETSASAALPASRCRPAHHDPAQ